MKNRIVSLAATWCFTSILILASGCSTSHSGESEASPMPGHEEQYSQGENTTSAKDEAGMMGQGGMKSGGMMNKGMMANKMDKGQMMDMMKNCLAKNNDKKVCEHEMMRSCQEKMDRRECASITKDVNE